MFKLCLLVLALCNAVFANNMSKVLNFTIGEGTTNKSSVITLNGQQNYNAVQHIFYLYGQHLSPLHKNVSNRQIPNDYIVTPGVAAHKLHIRHVTWNKARKICIEEGGQLAVIRSVAEELVMLKMLKDGDKCAAFLGIHDQFEEGDWVTVNDETLESTGFSKWTTKYAYEPNNFGGVQHCGALLQLGGMDDVNCDVTHPFFCKIDLQDS